MVLSLARWAYQRTFALSPPSWTLVLILALACIVLGATQIDIAGAWLTLLPAAAVGTAALAALGTWLWSARPARGRLKAFLSPFDERSADATRVAPLQAHALKSMIETDPFLKERLSVRGLRVPLDKQASVRLLRWTRGHCCVSGEVITAGGQARWAPRLAVRWTVTTGFITPSAILLRRPRLHTPTVEELEAEGLPIAVFTETEFRTEHSDSIRAALLILAGGELARHDDDSVAQALTTEAARYWGSMPPLLRALLAMQRDDLDPLGSDAEKLKARAVELARIGEESADHPYLWAEVAGNLTITEALDVSTPAERVPHARRSAAGFPKSGDQQFALAAALVGSAEYATVNHRDLDQARALCEEAIPILERALKLRRRDIPRHEVKRFLRIARIAAADPFNAWVPRPKSNTPKG